MTNLARKLRLIDYFALGFGTMVGTAWLVMMDDILQRSGPLGAILGFTAGALMLLPIAGVQRSRVDETDPRACSHLGFAHRKASEASRVGEATTNDYRWSSLIAGIVKSMPFQMRRAES